LHAFYALHGTSSQGSPQAFHIRRGYAGREKLLVGMTYDLFLAHAAHLKSNPIDIGDAEVSVVNNKCIRKIINSCTKPALALQERLLHPLVLVYVANQRDKYSI